MPRSENFWSAGGPGPCGPDTEMYYDRGEEHGCGEPDCRPACTRCERFLEFWNLVFMEFELHADGKLTPLPQQNVDTGMGVERAAAILQDVISVYETDGTRRSCSGSRARAVSRTATRGGDEGASHPCRPRPRHDLPRGGRRVAVERGTRLRDAADHPARAPPGLARRARLAVPVAARGGRHRAHEGGHPELEEHRSEIQRSSLPRRNASAGRSSAGCGSSRTSRRQAATSPETTRSACTTPTAFRSSCVGARA